MFTLVLAGRIAQERLQTHGKSGPRRFHSDDTSVDVGGEKNFLDCLNSSVTDSKFDGFVAISTLNVVNPR